MRSMKQLRRAVALTGALTLGLLMFGASPASAVVSCTFDSATGVLTVTTTGLGDNAVVKVDPATDNITVNGGNCIDPITVIVGTVNNTATIEWNHSGTAAHTFTVDLSGGLFVPGTPEAGTTDEIEFDLTTDGDIELEDNFIVNATSGNDVIRGGSADVPIGGAGDDDTVDLNGDGDGDAEYFVGSPIFSGLGGDDTLSFQGGGVDLGTAVTSQRVTLHGNAGNDDLFGSDNGGSDFLGSAPPTGVTEGGNDRITGGGGPDQMSGGDGTDVLDYLRETGTGGVTGTLPEPAPPTDSNEWTDTFGDTDDVFNTSFENVEGSPQVDVIAGNSIANVINGNGGGDDLNGAGGDDTLNGNDGNDEIDGDGGNDTENGGAGNDGIGTEGLLTTGDVGNDVMHGNDGSDVVIGGNGNDLVFGDAGDDGVPLGFLGAIISISGYAGNDTVDGGSGDDFMGGECPAVVCGSATPLDPGNDVYFPGPGSDDADATTGFDQLNYRPDPGPIDANLTLGFVNEPGTTDAIANFEGILGTTSGDDLACGGGFTSDGCLISGGQGNDDMFGSPADDRLVAGRGNDDVTGGGADDIIRTGAGNDDASGGGGADLVAGGGGDDELRGGGGDDILRGQPQDDDLHGGGGSDRCNGGAGFDTVTSCETGQQNPGRPLP